VLSGFESLEEIIRDVYCLSFKFVLHGLNQGFDGLFLNLDSEAELLLLFG
jgi:hypothetical protein